MSLIQSITPCEDVQIALNTVFTRTNPELTFENAGWLTFLTDPINTMGVEQISEKTSPGGGKLRTVNVRHKIRLNEDQVDSGFAVDCTPSETVGDVVNSYSIDPDVDGTHISRTLALEDIRDNCTSNADWLMEIILTMVNTMDRSQATKMADQVSDVLGRFQGGSTFKVVQTVDSSGNNTQNLLENVKFDTMDAQYPGKVFAFGYGELVKYDYRLKAGCCVQTGIDLRDFSNQNQLTIMPDYRVEDALGENIFFTTTPGACQILQFNQYDGKPNTVNDDSFEARGITSPQTGLNYDLFMERVCADTYNITIRTATKLVGMPTDMFGSADRLSGVTFVNQFNIQN